MICPFGYEVDEPPRLDRCVLRERGCPCEYELTMAEHWHWHRAFVQRWWNGLVGSDREALPD